MGWRSAASTFFTYRRVGSMMVCLNGLPSRVAGTSAPHAQCTLRTRLKPLECTPLEARPSTTSPVRTLAPVRILTFPPHQRQNQPDRIRRRGTCRAFQRFRRRSARSRSARSLWHAAHHRCCGVHVQTCRRQSSPGKQRLGACTSTSFTLMATRSMPTVSCMFHSKASLSWCPRRRCCSPAPAPGSAWAPQTARRSRRCRPSRLRAGFSGQRLDALDQRVARVDVNAGVFVRNGRGGRSSWNSKRGWRVGPNQRF